jgi:hypothetical protein
MSEPERELTVLCYFASDNPLAPLVISEIKAIKDAGFQANTSVLVYFDPMVKGVPTQLFDVNRRRREEDGTQIGDGPDPFVRNMTEDEIQFAEVARISPAMANALEKSGNVNAVESLRNFIDFAMKTRKAKNYILFLLGHGMIVANDTFLPDDDPPSGISLKEFKDLCAKFNEGDSRLRMLALHSCSMSSVEVAYELKGQADYMLATQGEVFINAFPYRQMLKKTLNQVKRAKNDKKDVDYDELINKLYFLCLHNFTDFLNAGFSCDLVLCSLEPERLKRLKDPLTGLVSLLKEELARDSVVKDLVLLAHWDSQSFFSENYTDLLDFCDRLAFRCEGARNGLGNTAENERLATRLRDISKQCNEIKDVLAPADRGARTTAVVRHADNGGTDFQFAHGLSIYFPWSKPLDDQRTTVPTTQDGSAPRPTEAKGNRVMALYKGYDFTAEFGEHSWFSFLERYFEDTKRKTQDPRDNAFSEYREIIETDEATIGTALNTAAISFFNGVTLKKTAQLKKTPQVGGDCTCPSIKNFPTDRERPDSRRFWITPNALEAFIPQAKKKKPRDE